MRTMRAEKMVRRVVIFVFSVSRKKKYASGIGQKITKNRMAKRGPRNESMSSLMYELLYSTEILAQIWKNILRNAIVSSVWRGGDTIAFWKKYYGKCDSMSSNVNLFTIVNLIYYTRVRVCIGWQNY